MYLPQVGFMFKYGQKLSTLWGLGQLTAAEEEASVATENS